MNIKKQAGMTMWGVMALVIILVANGLAALKIVPIYMDNMTIEKIMQSYEERLKTERISKTELRKGISRNLLINNIRDLKKDQIVVIQSPKKTKIQIKYEVRRNLYYNLDVVVSFDNVLEVTRS